MNCKNCGTILSSTSKFCLNCGTPVENVSEVTSTSVETVTMPPQEQTVITQSVQPTEIPAELFAPVAPVQPIVPEMQPVQSVAPVTQAAEIPAELFAPVTPVQPVDAVTQQVVEPASQPIETPAELFAPVTPVQPVAQPVQVVEPVTQVAVQPETVQAPAVQEVPAELFAPVTPVQPVLETVPQPVETSVELVAPVQPVVPEVQSEVVQEVPAATPQVPTTIPGVPNPVFPDTLVEPIKIEEPVVPAAPIAPAQNSTTVIEQGIAETQTTGLPVGEPKPIPEVTVNPVAPTQPAQPVAPVVEQPVPAQPVSQPVEAPSKPQKDNKLLYFIIGLVIVTAIIVAVLFAVFGGKGEEETTANGGNNTPTTPVVEVPMYDYVQGKFKYRIPTKYTVQEQSGYIALYNNTYYMEFAPVEGYSFATLTESDAKSVIERMGATVITSKTTESNGRKYAVVRAVYSGIDCVFVLDKSAKDYAMVGFGYKLDYTYNEQLETEIISILESVKYSSSVNLESKVDIDLFQIFQ